MYNFWDMGQGETAPGEKGDERASVVICEISGICSVIVVYSWGPVHLPVIGLVLTRALISRVPIKFKAEKDWLESDRPVTVQLCYRAEAMI